MSNLIDYLKLSERKPNMKLNIYSMYDQAAQAYLPPVYLENDNVAKRAIQNAVNTQDHQFNQNPADYTLFHLGEWDDCTATITMLKTPNVLAKCNELLTITE